MRVIDLLNKIANGEPPKKIKYKGEVYIYREQDGNMIYQLKGFHVVLTLQCFEDLLNEVEIIEEGEEPKKINELRFLDNSTDNEDILRMKINEIIDFLNQGDKE